jgi:hypothetical protein
MQKTLFDMNTEELYVKGFNAGYLLSKHEPGLLASIIKNLQPTAPYLDGIFSGKAEQEQEMSTQNLDEIANIRGRSEEIDREQELE